MTSETPQTPDREASGPREGGPATGAPRPPFRSGGPRPGGPGGSRGFGPPGARRPRRKVCVFCLEKVKRIDYKDKPRLQRFLSDRAKIDPRRKSGNCAKHQRMLTTALKRARYMALLPYTADHVRAMMSPRDRAIAGGPPPARPDRGPRTFFPRPAPEGAAPRPAPAAPATPGTPAAPATPTAPPAPPVETPKTD